MGKQSKVKAILTAVTVIILIVAVGLFSSSKGTGKNLDNYLVLGAKYLEDLDYDNAIAAYTKALEIDELSVEAYLGLADAYIGKGDVDKAIEILQKGNEKTGDERLQSKLELLKSENGALESKLTPIKVKCTLLDSSELTDTIIEEYRKEHPGENFSTASTPWGVKFSEPVEFISSDGSDTVTLTEAAITGIDFDSPLAHIGNGTPVWNDNYFGKEMELYFDPYAYLDPRYTGNQMSFDRYEDDGTPYYLIFPLGGYQVNINSKSIELLEE